MAAVEGGHRAGELCAGRRRRCCDRFELDSVEQAKRYIDDFPLSKAGLLEWHYIGLDAPLPLEFLFDSSVDVGQPWDRTTKD